MMKLQVTALQSYKRSLYRCFVDQYAFNSYRMVSTMPAKPIQLQLTDASKIEEALEVDRLNAPSTFPPPLTLPEKSESANQLKYLLKLGKAYLQFYKSGTKQILANRKVSKSIKQRFAGDALLNPVAGPSTQHLGEASPATLHGEQLSRAQYQLVLRSAIDSKKLPVFGLLFLVFGEWLPLLVFFLSPLLPGTVLLPKQILSRRQKRARIARKVALPTGGMPERQFLLQSCRQYGLVGPFASITPTSILNGRYVRHQMYLAQDSKLLAKQAQPVKLLDDLELDQALEERGLWHPEQTRHHKETSLQKWLQAQTRH
ncbi:hypothetical protein BCR37DRAFT_143974 [Protomyces lactucae-debilis]|uniref:Letm1 RBD domain-containing protein n=1 Tax=Protomyces lactucae-debilis TaxID=2754530 RepID=A0A1Y2FT11_PROLT|nr:uncharacterized protein BCR37DRAFT_143974 [Protomyces lactucae-debilis]ORY87132.1 hypothetical protein BCR37DRAFT_143974 [Protomyces lactucae-debilis]